MGYAKKKASAGLLVSDGAVLPIDYVTKTAAILAQRRKGKRLALDTPLPTPSGWTTMGDIRVGDELFDEVGEPCRVTYVAEVAWGDSYRVRFSDGSEIVADAEHLWVTESRSVRRRESAIKAGVLTGGGREDRPQCQQTSATMPQIRTTAEIAATLRNGGETNHSIRVALPLDLPDAELPVDPYVLGFWLGDGTRGYGAVTIHDSDAVVLDDVRRAGYEARERPSQRKGGTASYTILGLQPQLRALGVLREKHVPDVYLRSSEEQRIALLQGIADADGSCSEQGQVEISASDPRLARDIYELVVSLGIKATQTWRETAAKPSCRIRFTTPTPVFRLARKLRRQPTTRTTQIGRRFIESITKTASVPMRCIAVDSSSRLFLAGESMIPTHNTYLGCDLAEELVYAELPWVALDPTGAWWGLRSSADGESPGLPVVVIGGQHGDLPLEREAGAVIADLVLDHPGWYVLDLSLLDSRAAERDFSAAFGDRLHRRKMQPGMDFPLHLFVDEADLFVPQEKETTWNSASRKGKPDVLAVYQGIVRRGGLHGLGSTLISQRPALVNKNALTQIDILFLLRLVAGQDQDAVYKNNVSRFLPKKEADELMATLATMPIGEGWVLEPGADPPLRERVRFRARDTFNSSATPKAGERRVEPRVLAEIDLDALRGKMEGAIERAKEDDPVELRRRIRDLQRTISEAPATVPAAETVEVRVEVPVVSEEAAALAREAVDEIRHLAKTIEVTLSFVPEKLGPLAEALARGEAVERAERTPAGVPARASAVEREREFEAVPAAPAKTAAPSAGTNGALGVAARGFLETMARFYPMPLTLGQLGLLARKKTRGGSFNTAMRELRDGGYLADDGGLLALTERGADAAGVAPEPMTLDRWRDVLPVASREILDEVVAAGADGITTDEVSARTGRAPRGGSWNTAMKMLSQSGTVERRGERLVLAGEYR